MIKNRIFIFIVACALCIITLASGTLIYALKYKEKNVSYGTQVGQAKIVSINNSTKTSKIELSANSSHQINVSVNLSCNVDGVVRVKVSPRFYNELDQLTVLPNNLTYVFNETQGQWLSDANYMCFYFNETVKNISTLNFLSSILTPNNELLNGYKLDLVVEAEILQLNGVDYANHPWKDNAPAEWLNKFKNL